MNKKVRHALKSSNDFIEISLFLFWKKKKTLKDITKEMIGNGMLGNRARLDQLGESNGVCSQW